MLMIVTICIVTIGIPNVVITMIINNMSLRSGVEVALRICALGLGGGGCGRYVVAETFPVHPAKACAKDHKPCIPNPFTTELETISTQQSIGD